MLSVAKTLGALSVSAQLFHSSKQRPILSELVSDKEAVSSCVRFAGVLYFLIIYFIEI